MLRAFTGSHADKASHVLTFSVVLFRGISHYKFMIT